MCIPRGLVFETAASEGAILTMPEGAVSFDLENIPAFREYVAENVEKWYKFVNGVRGREAKNGDVRLVIGCEKTTSWGMAALANVTQHKISRLKFKVTENSSVKSTRPPYTWDYSGVAEVRVGPDIREINALRSNDDRFDATPPSDEEFSNQCLFIRTLNATLNDEAWKALNDNLGLMNVLDSSPSSRTISPETPPRYQRNTYNTSFNTPQSSTSFGTQRSSIHPTQHVFRVYTTFFEPLRRSFLYHTQLNDVEEAVQNYRKVVPPSRIPHHSIESDTQESRLAVSTTTDGNVNCYRTSWLIY